MDEDEWGDRREMVERGKWSEGGAARGRGALPVPWGMRATVRTDGRTDGRMDEQTDGRTEGWQ